MLKVVCVPDDSPVPDVIPIFVKIVLHAVVPFPGIQEITAPPAVAFAFVPFNNAFTSIATDSVAKLIVPDALETVNVARLGEAHAAFGPVALEAGQPLLPI